MRALRNVLIAAGAAVVLVGGTAHAGTVIVEGEDAVSYETGCGDGGDANDMGPLWYGSRNTMFFPASGCSATYDNTGATSVSSAVVILSGVAGSICGTLTVSGTLSGSKSFCATNDTVVTVNLTTPAVSASGDYTVTWTTTGSTPSYANLFLDYLVGSN